ncbi:hypothetical protein DAPPUDRAFT_340346 [Daphnia pulex]|uniref:Uncharacterized protein n=1 Tax=Daphnia pulex TaxID=6669 RepID=E9I427_DAPPU|nr:hypothetical protein DAPPUDRAFT_340346 [Daphnia pulex]|eukprot:EFX61253.1 hypothetical protein DAPPUDRAFT_340346 [Daphnia pulex]
MDENAALLYELNLMRKNERTFEREKKEMGVVLEKLQRELADNYKSTNVISTRAHTTATKRATASRDVLSREKSLLIDMNEYGQSGTTREIKSRSRVRSRMSSASKTPVLRQ